MLTEEPTTRAGFVKRLGKLVAVGLGVALVPATTAFANPFQCCRNTNCDADCKPFPGLFGFRCPSNPCASCCTCLSQSSGCVTYQNCCRC
jgi:hypothetical protein